MPQKSSCQVLIVGADVTGLSCAFHLKKQGIKNIKVVPAGHTLAAADASAGITSAGQLDNFTRVSHAHGYDFAVALWQMGTQGFEALMEYCQTHKVPSARGKRLRLVVSEAELIEVKKAVSELQRFQADTQLISPDTSYTNRVLAIQDEGLTAATLNSERLLATLAQETSCEEDIPITEFEADAQGVRIERASGSCLEAEVAVLACHLTIRKFLPVLDEALVSVADQWAVAPLNGKSHPLVPGSFWSANHTYEWGAIAPDGRHLIFGGGRYLRPMAGIEASSADYQDFITDHLVAQHLKTWQQIPLADVRKGKAGLDCRPCDELPIVGPMFGQDRVLVGTGYMGNSLAMGFQAGKCLADLIAKGQSTSLPRRLWPERLRTMRT